MKTIDFYNSLDSGVKEKLKACKSLEEARQVLVEEKITLDPEVLEEINGGRVLDKHLRAYWIDDGGDGSTGSIC